MYANGFFEQKRRSPASLALVVGLHSAAFGALILFGTTTYIRDRERNPIVINVPIPDDPPPIPPPPRPDERTPEHVSVPTPTPPDTPPISDNPIQTGPPQPQQPPVGQTRRQNVETALANVPQLPPVRRAAEVDPNFRDALQPPYPPGEERLQRGGQVRIRITIGTNGRVTAIQQLSATSEAFWRATERQARTRWRFRPATLDGRPIELSMNMTVTFRIPDA